MDRALVGRAVLSFVLVATIVAEIGFTWFGWTGEHIFNSSWHAHGRFHTAQQMSFLIFLALVGLWLSWRRGDEHRVFTTRVFALLVAAHWAAEFFAFSVPGTSPSPELDEPNTFSLLGLDIYGNLFFSGAMIAFAAVAIALTAARARTATEPPQPG